MMNETTSGADMSVKTWTEMTDLEQSAAIWWDLYKDVHGVRPRGVDTSNWTREGFEHQIRALLTQLAEVNEDEDRVMREAIETFESRIEDNIAYGAATREDAIRWMHHAYETDGDADLLEFRLGLPMNYIKSSSVAQ
jgi:hypothetical protein